MAVNVKKKVIIRKFHRVTCASRSLKRDYVAFVGGEREVYKKDESDSSNAEIKCTAKPESDIRMLAVRRFVRRVLGLLRSSFHIDGISSGWYLQNGPSQRSLRRC